eukprot:TRINITY_DN6256_c0_g1_i1.p1 TRINITY_DN6256_c0_g1~~TRINITY_DN6256_c0_g1_i1.p1  ORF type:complete len:783 (+),score=313.24 TRINITY_DN6256_c0_g1_i1:113-2350(+)
MAAGAAGGQQEELSFSRQDLTAVASCNRSCMRVLPRTDGKAKKQKLAVADSTGMLHVFQMEVRTAEFRPLFRSPSPSGKPVACIDLVEEKIFVASGDCVRAFTKKGREFFKVETTLSEPIASMAVRTPWIWTAGDYVVACFEEGTEIAYLNTPDKVNDLIMEPPPPGEKVHMAVVGCQDRMLRMIKGKEIITHEPCEGSVVTVRSYLNTGKDQKDGPTREIHYGTDNGCLGSFRSNPSGGLQKRWVVENPDKRGGISALCSKDLTGDGVQDIIVGRDDGAVEVFGFEAGQAEPQLLWKATVNETVQAIDTGCVAQLGKDEIVACTYTGKLLSFCHDARTDDLPVKVPGASAPRPSLKKGGASAVGLERRKRLQLLEEEIERLKQRLEGKRDEYSKMSDEMVAVTVKHNIKDKFVLDSSAAWTLTIELDSPIDTIALQSDVDIELLDTDASTCIVSTSKPYETDKKTKLLACYRCTESTTRMEMKVRTVEGQYGILRAFIIPFLSPKTCQLCTYNIKPLSLHQRLNEAKTMPDEVCTVHVTGSFSVNDMHSWVSDCLPEVPSMLHEQSACYYFQSTFQNTLLKCAYRQGEATFVSDNISCLMVIRDYITYAATTRKIKVNVNVDAANLDSSCRRVLELLHEKLQYQLGLSEKVKLIEALKEIEMQEQDVTFLAQDYRDIIGSARQIEREHKLQPRRLEFLYGIVRKLYMDKHKTRGQSPQQKIPQLMQKLQENYRLSDLQDFFTHS